MWKLKTHSITDPKSCTLLMYIMKSHEAAQLKCLVTTFLIRAVLLCVFCLYSMLTSVVFISHLCHRPFKWEQWLLLPWTLFHGSKDKRVAWKEETRPAQSQTQQEQHRAIDSYFPPSQPTGKASLAPGRREWRNTYNTQTSPCTVILPGKKEETNSNKPDVFELKAVVRGKRNHSLRWSGNFLSKSFPRFMPYSQDSSCYWPHFE